MSTLYVIQTSKKFAYFCTVQEVNFSAWLLLNLKKCMHMVGDGILKLLVYIINFVDEQNCSLLIILRIVFV